MNHLRILTVLMLSLGLGCKETDTAPKPSIPPSKKAPPAPVPDAPLDPQAVHNLIEAWVAAQNDADFPTYIDLYADTFEGIKRTGSLEYRYGKDGWRTERGKLFQTPRQIKITNTSVNIAGQAAVVRFIQTSSVDKFQWQTRKSLVVYNTGGELKVGREEVLAAPNQELEAKGVDPNAAAILLDEQYIVLSSTVKPEWLRGSAQPDANAQAAKAVHLSKLPKVLRSWKGRSVNIYNGHGKKICVSPVVGLRAIVRFVPHFAMTNGWYTQDGTPKLGPKVIADQAFDASTNPVLVAKIKSPCAGGVMARTLPLPKILVGREVPKVPAEVFDKFRQVRGVIALQKAFEASGESGRWFEGAQQYYREFNGDAGKFAVYGLAVEPKCDKFSGSFWTIFRLDNDTPQLLTDPVNPGPFFWAQAAIDVDSDGAPEFIGREQIVRSDPDGVWRVVNDVRKPHLDTGC